MTKSARGAFVLLGLGRVTGGEQEPSSRPSPSRQVVPGALAEQHREVGDLGTHSWGNGPGRDPALVSQKGLHALVCRLR